MLVRGILPGITQRGPTPQTISATFRFNVLDVVSDRSAARCAAERLSLIQAPWLRHRCDDFYKRAATLTAIAKTPPLVVRFRAEDCAFLQRYAKTVAWPTEVDQPDRDHGPAPRRATK